MPEADLFSRGYERPNRSWYYELPAQLAQGLLAATSGTLYTAPASPTSGAPRKARLEEIVLCNCDTSARTVTLYVVPNGGSAGDATSILAAFSIAANTTLVLPLATIIEASGTLRGLASVASKVAYTVTGTEFYTTRTA